MKHIVSCDKHCAGYNNRLASFKVPIHELNCLDKVILSMLPQKAVTLRWKLIVQVKVRVNQIKIVDFSNY